MPDLIQESIDTAANWTSNNPILEAGRIGLESDTGRGKFGDGIAHWATLPYLDDYALDNAVGTGSGGGGSPTDQIPWQTGLDYYCPFSGSAGSSAVGTPTGLMYFQPIAVSRALTISAMVAVNSATGIGVIRAGAYDSDPTTKQPKNRLFTAGTITNATTVGVHTVSTSQTISPSDDPIWIAWLIETVGGTWRGGTLTRAVLGKDTSSTPGPYNALKATGVTTGSLPSTAPSATPTTDIPIAVGFRAA